MSLKAPRQMRDSSTDSPRPATSSISDDQGSVHFAHSPETDGVGLMARVLVQTTIPHSAQPGQNFRRRNGDLTMTMVAHPDHGLPYGKIPRLLLAWMARKAKTAGTRELKLPASQAALFRQLGVRVSGGATGSLKAVREQALRLVKCTVHIDRRLDSGETWHPYQFASGVNLWWDRSDAARSDSACWIELAPGFYEEIISNSVPLDFSVLVALRSPLAIDIYAWATDRVYRLNKPTLLPWVTLQGQFGSSYARLIDFRFGFERALKHVHLHWPGLRAEPEAGGLRLRPCRPHISPLVSVAGFNGRRL